MLSHSQVLGSLYGLHDFESWTLPEQYTKQLVLHETDAMSIHHRAGTSSFIVHEECQGK